MAHIRQQIRDNIKSIIEAAAVPFTLVTTSRTAAIGTENMPCLLIKTPEERVAPRSLGFPRIFDRAVGVELHIYVASNTPQNDIDAIALLMEKALFASMTTITLNGIAKFIQLDRVTIDDAATAQRAWIVARYYLTAGILVQESTPDVLQ